MDYSKLIEAGIDVSGLPGAGIDEEIATQLKKRPKYKISPEYAENVGLAKGQAFGRDRSIMQQEENIEQGAADAIGQARDFSSSTSGLLGALANITGSKNTALRGLAADEAAIQNQKLAALMGTNVSMAEERDKAWNYNENQPYQTKVADLVQRRKNKQEMPWKILDTITAGGLSLLGGRMGQAAPVSWTS